MIMSYTRRTAGRKTTKQLDGMNAKQLQALASAITKKMKELGGHPDETTEWKKRLYHINQAKNERTVKIKSGDNYMENLKRHLVKAKVTSRTSKGTGNTAARTRDVHPGDHTYIRTDAIKKQQQHDNGDMQCSTCTECNNCHECHQCICCYSCHECPQVKEGEMHRCINLQCARRKKEIDEQCKNTGRQAKIQVYHIGEVNRATYEVVSGATDAETDRRTMVEDCDRKCHETDEPLNFNTAEEDRQDDDETLELIETEDEDESNTSTSRRRQLHAVKTARTTPESSPDRIQKGEQGNRLRTREPRTRIQTGDMKYVPAVLNGYPIALLYDTICTCTSICTISEGTIRRMGMEHLVYSTSKARCWTASGEFHLEKAIQLKMMILGAMRTTQFMVTPQGTPSDTPLLGTPVTDPSDKELQGPAWETRPSKQEPSLSTAWKGDKHMTYLYKQEHMAKWAANWLAANYIAPSTQLKLSITTVSNNMPIRVITVKEGMKRTLKNQKWVITSNSGAFQAVV